MKYGIFWEISVILQFFFQAHYIIHYCTFHIPEQYVITNIIEVASAASTHFYPHFLGFMGFLVNYYDFLENFIFAMTQHP